MALTRNETFWSHRLTYLRLAIPILFLAAWPFFYEKLGVWVKDILGPVKQWGTFHVLSAVGVAVTKAAPGEWPVSAPRSLYTECVGNGSVGILGIGAFMALLAYFFVREPDRMKPLRWLAILIAGVPYVLALNVLRVSLAILLIIEARDIHGTSLDAVVRAKEIGSYLGIPTYGFGLSLYLYFVLKKKRVSGGHR